MRPLLKKMTVWVFAVIATAATTVFSADLTITSFAPYAGQTNIVLQATGNVIFSGGALTLPALPTGSTGLLSVQAGNNITFSAGTSISAGNNWNVSLTAGTGLPPGTTPPSGSYGIYLNDNSYLQTQNGNITLWASNEVQVASDSSGNQGITTRNGGSISVITQYGDVNAGSNPQGFSYRTSAPYYTVSQTLGGISTAAGGDVTITAAGNVISYLPFGNTSVAAQDGGSGAFGSQPGNVTITAGGNVFGHYVVANGTGSITAGQNVGDAFGNNPFALSLINGSWSVNATNGNIYLQEVRNPNGVFNNLGVASSHGYHFFDYAPQASVDLTATGVYLTDENIPRPNGNVQVLYPRILDIAAGSNGLTLEGNVTLFPGANQNLSITVTEGGNLVGSSNLLMPPNPVQLLLSDSSQTQWQNVNTFGPDDHGSTPTELGNPQPVTVNVSGSMENLELITSKATQITVGGGMTNCGFSGENLNAADVTSINVTGQITNQSAYSFVTLSSAIPALPTSSLPPGISNSWDNIFLVALNPAVMANLQVPTNLPASQWFSYVLQNASLFGFTAVNGPLTGHNPGFVYTAATEQLGFAGPMPQIVLSELTQPITALVFGGSNSVPLTYVGVGGNTYFYTTQVGWVDPSKIESLDTASLGAPALSAAQLGYRIGGPGQFNVNAGSISLGNTYGILSCGVEEVLGGFGRYQNLAPETPSAATVNVTVAGDLNMETAAIAVIGQGGNVNVNNTGGAINLGFQGVFNSAQVPPGIFTSGQGDVTVLALGNIDISDSHIAAYNGGDIFVESLQGNVMAGNVRDVLVEVPVSYVNPGTGTPGYSFDMTVGGGIFATLLGPSQLAGNASVAGDITVLTPRGDIITSAGGIIQADPGGSLPAGPTITLVAGTPPNGGSTGYTGNIYLGEFGVIGGAINLMATGSISGLISNPNSPINALITAAAGTNVEFAVTAQGAEPISYQWFMNDISLPGETNDLLYLTNVKRADAGHYSVVVSNATSVVTNFFQLHVLVPQRLTASFAQTNQTLSVSFGDADGGTLSEQDISTFVIQTSTNLVDWAAVYLPISTNGNGGLSFQAPVSSDFPCGFYRILSQ